MYHKCTANAANIHSSYTIGLHFSHTHMSNRQPCCVIFSADINECEEDLDDCHEYATCINTIGSYECICNPGSTGDGRNCIGENMAMCTVQIGFVTVCVSVHVCLSFILGVATGCVYAKIKISGIDLSSQNYVTTSISLLKSAQLCGKVRAAVQGS